MKIFRNLLTKIALYFAPTQAEVELSEEFRRRAVREEQRVRWSCEAANLTEHATERVLQYFRDQRAVGVDLGTATWRARTRIVSNPFKIWSTK